jgi:hypothetical protein
VVWDGSQTVVWDGSQGNLGFPLKTPFKMLGPGIEPGSLQREPSLGPAAPPLLPGEAAAVRRESAGLTRIVSKKRGQNLKFPTKKLTHFRKFSENFQKIFENFLKIFEKFAKKT